MREAQKTFFSLLIFFVFFPFNLFSQAKVSLLLQKKISDDPLRGRDWTGTSELSIGDLFPQRNLSIVSQDNQFIFLLDGATGETLWSYEIGYAIIDPIIDDIDQDGNLEIIMGNSAGSVFVLDPYKKNLKKTFTVGYEVIGIMVSDVNSDGVKDIGVLGRERGISEHFSLVDGKSFAPVWGKKTKVERGTGGGKSAFTKSGNRRQLVILNWGNITYCYDALTGEEVWSHNYGERSFFGITFKNMAKAIGIIAESQEKPVNIVIGTSAGGIFVYDMDGKKLREADIGGSPLGNVGFIINLSTGDLNGDSYPDIVASSIDHKVYAVDGKTMKLLWKYKTGDEVYSSPALADMNNDGRLDVVVVPDDSYVYCIDGSKGKLIWKYALSERHQAASAELADVNRDGYIDVVTGSLYGTLTVLTTDARCEKGAILWGRKHGSNRIAGY